MGNARSYKQGGVTGSFDAIVVGSGMGGLATAAILAREAGKRVLVLERHYEVGGFTHTFRRRGFEWDVGVHYIGDVGVPGRGLHPLFESVSDGSLRWASMGEVHDSIFVAGERYDFPRGKDAWARRMGEYFPAQAEVIARYLGLIEQAGGQMQFYLAEKGLPLNPDALPEGEAFALVSKTTAEVVGGLTDDPRLRAVLTAQLGDYGLPPSQSAFGIHALVTLHYLGGGYYPVGGSSRIYQSIAPVIEAAGGLVLACAEVEQILVEGGRACGVRMADGVELRAPVVVSDAGAANTVHRLVAPDVEALAPLRAAVDRLRPSCAHLALYLGFEHSDAALGNAMTNHWVYASEDHDGTFARQLGKPDDGMPFAYISFPSAKDPDFQRRYPGRATVEVVTLASLDWFEPWRGTQWMKRGADYEAFKERLTGQLLEVLFAQCPQLRGKVAVAELGTPLTTAHFSGHPGGEIYGLAQSPQRFREHCLRPQTPLPGLFLSGVDVAVCGVGGALVGGVNAAGAVLQDPGLFGRALGGQLRPR